MQPVQALIEVTDTFFRHKIQQIFVEEKTSLLTLYDHEGAFFADWQKHSLHLHADSNVTLIKDSNLLS